MTLPIVTNVDRDWALAQKPDWARMSREDASLNEISDDDGWMDAERIATPDKRAPTWFDFVVGEIESFERFFSGQQKTYAEWSSLWRKGWWPKRREDWVFKEAPKVLHPFFKRGSEEFERALTVANKNERRLWQQFGVAQFKPDDPRLSSVRCA